MSKTNHNDFLPLNRFIDEATGSFAARPDMPGYTNYVPMPPERLNRLLRHVRPDSLSVSFDHVVYWEIDIVGVVFNVMLSPYGGEMMIVNAMLRDARVVDPQYLQVARKMLSMQMEMMLQHGDLDSMPNNLASLNLKFPGRLRIRGNLGALDGVFRYTLEHEHDSDFLYATIYEVHNNPLETVDWLAADLDEVTVDGVLPFSHGRNMGYSIPDTRGLNVDFDLIKERGRLVRDGSERLWFETSLFGKLARITLDYLIKGPDGSDHTADFEWRSSKLRILITTDQNFNDNELSVAYYYAAWLFGAFHGEPAPEATTINTRSILYKLGTSFEKLVLPTMVNYSEVRLPETSGRMDVINVDVTDGVATVKLASYEEWIKEAENDPDVSRADLCKIFRFVVDELRTAEDY